ncbi:hypothetical protein M885DRAFT_509986 [Pelagophyceae sp. CCMP2097]|nr:hypothetical protein M885DRAFT_509986 [Pelagophyceae sp. CCMP2097]
MPPKGRRRRPAKAASADRVGLGPAAKTYARRRPAAAKTPRMSFARLADDVLRAVCTRVPVRDHGALKRTCSRVRLLMEDSRFAVERAEQGYVESALVCAGGTDTAEDAWVDCVFVLDARGEWARRRGLANPIWATNLARRRARSNYGDAAVASLFTGDMGSCAAVGGQLMVVGPVVHVGVASNSFMTYDARKDSWLDSFAHGRRTRSVPVACPAMRLPRRFGACGAVNGRLIVAGGESDEAVSAQHFDEDEMIGAMLITDTCEAFNPETREWEADVAPLPLGVSGAAFAAVNGRLLVAGGTFMVVRDGAPLMPDDEGDIEEESDLLQIYDAQTNSWTTSKLVLDGDPLLFPGYAAGCDDGRGNFVVVCGGSCEHIVVDDGVQGILELVERAPKTFLYNTRTETWTEEEALPHYRDGFSAALFNGGVVVVGGGPVLEYRNQHWTPVANAPPQLLDEQLERPALATIVLG